jgi:ABC-type multidrug transport system ATPase subunit
MRQIFECALNNDITMVLTSHSMDECEILCSRLGIMSQGQFICLGNIQDLKNEFGNIYTIDIKINSNLINFNFQDLYLFLKSQIQIQISNQTESTIIFQVENVSPAQLFHLIESIKSQFHIETYSIQQMTLEQIFISLQNSNNQII